MELHRLERGSLRVRPLGGKSRSALGPRDGLVIRFGADERGWPDALAVVPDLRHGHPDRALLFWADRCSADQHVVLAEHARDVGVRAVIRSEQPSPPFLWRQIADPVGLARAIVIYLRHTGGLEDPWLGGVLEQLLALAPAANLRRSTKVLAISGRTLTDRLRAADLPSPGRWTKFMRLMLPLLRIQKEPIGTASMWFAAEGLGSYKDFAQRCRQQFGASPRELQALFGFEPLVARWIDSGTQLIR